MAFSKTTNTPREKEIRYLNKTFNDFKAQLTDFAESYFPDTFNDFSDSSPGVMFMEMASYVGDVLSYYQNTQLIKNPSNPHNSQLIYFFCLLVKYMSCHPADMKLQI